MNSIPSSLHTPLRRHVSQCVRRCSSPLHQRSLATSRHLGAAAKQARYGTQAAREQHGKYKRSIRLAATGMVLSAAAMYATIRIYFPNGMTQPEQSDTNNQDGQKSDAAIKLDGPNGLIVDDQTAVIINGIEQIPTSNSTVPHFPKTITLPRTIESSESRSAAALKVGDQVIDNSGIEEEYQLLGLGIRTVSFLSIQVYVVGMYIAKSDIPVLQQRLVKRGATPAVTGAEPSDISASATSLVPPEREALKTALLSPDQGEEIWNQVLKEGGIRTVFRIVPTRNTDFLHLRDGWVRSVTGRAQKANSQVKEIAAKMKKEAPDATSIPLPEFDDDSFGNSLHDFKIVLGGGIRKNVPKGQTLILLRDARGALEVLYQPGNATSLTWLGEVNDERISRLVWMGYLAGKTVASEGARTSIVEGMMGLTSRPVGSVEMKIV